jgi:Rhomboid family
LIFFPYKADLVLNRLPIITVLVALLCVFVFLEQQSSASAYSEALHSYCNENTQRSMQMIARYLPEHEESHPCRVLLVIHEAQDPDGAIRKLADESQPIPFYNDVADGRQYIASVLKEQYTGFARRVPHDLSDDLVYDPNDLRFGRMMTSVVSHGSWSHLIGNLLFFYAFAAAVELI